MPGGFNRVLLTGEVTAIEDSPRVLRLTLMSVDQWTDREGKGREKRQVFRVAVMHAPSRSYLGSGAVRVGDDLLIEGQLESRGAEGQEMLVIVLGGLYSSVQIIRRASERRGEP